MKPVNLVHDEEALDALIADIIGRATEADIPIDWRSDQPLPSGGDRKSFYRGAGQDFYELDRYEPGYDDPRFIDWAATARMGGREVIKTVFQEPRDIKMIAMVDISPTMEFGTKRTYKRILAAEILAAVMVSAEEMRDRAGAIVFSKNRVEDDLPARSVSVNLYPALRSALSTEATADGAAPDSGDGFAKAIGGLPYDRSLVFVISDFLNFSKEDWAALEEISVLHDVVCVYIQDERERKLPAPAPVGGMFGSLVGLLDRIGWFMSLQDHTGERVTIWNSKKTRAEYAANWKAHEAKVIAHFDNAHTQWLVVSTEEGDAAIPKIINLFTSHA